MDWAATALELVWIGGLAATPVALFAALCSRCRALRPATRHSVWIAVLATFIAPAITAGLWRADWFRSERVLAAADSLVRPATTPETVASSPVAPRATSADRLTPRSPSRSAPRIDTAQEKPPELATPPRPTTLRADPGPAKIDISASREPATVPAQSSLSPRRGAPAPATEPAPVKADQPRAASWNDQFRGWTVSILAVRDALAAVPPIPPIVWLAGAGVAALFCIARIAVTRRIVGRGVPAPPSVEAMVRRVARIAGVARPPTVVMVADRVSPMICCGLRPRLVLPRALWEELDPQSQCAVIVHELSHLRRRDHWLCWAEGLIALAYWWHPVAWWARRRLHDEAEACCDAWVTTLMPNGRRAYAEALVATKSFLSLPGGCGAPGLGVLNGRTRQLARRLTMVMTQRVAPRASVVGLAFALAVAAAGTLVMPSLACPPTEEKAKADAQKIRVHADKARAEADKAREKALAAAEKARANSEKVRVKIQAQAEKNAKRAAERQVAAAKRGAERAARAQAEPQFLGEAPALESMRRLRNADPNAADMEKMARALKEREEALRQLEQRLREMERRLQELQRQQDRPGRRSLAPGTPAPMSVPAGVAAPALAPTPPAHPVTTPAPVTGQAPLGLLQSARVAQTTANDAPLLSYLTTLSDQAPVVAVPDGPTQARPYSLPEGKLDAVTDLMARDDVPILIERQDDHIIIHGTPAQHRIIRAFFQLISPETAGVMTNDAAPGAYTVLAPRGDSLPELQMYYEQLGRNDVAAAHGQAAEHLRAELETIHEHLAELHEHAADMKAGEEDCCEDDADDESDEDAEEIEADDDGALSRLDELTAHLDRIEAQLEALAGLTEGLDSQFDAYSGQFESLAGLPAVEVVAVPAEAPAAPDTPTADQPAPPAAPEPARADPHIPAPPAPPSATR